MLSSNKISNKAGSESITNNAGVGVDVESVTQTSKTDTDKTKTDMTIPTNKVGEQDTVKEKEKEHAEANDASKIPDANDIIHATSLVTQLLKCMSSPASSSITKMTQLAHENTIMRANIDASERNNMELTRKLADMEIRMQQMQLQCDMRVLENKSYTEKESQHAQERDKENAVRIKQLQEDNKKERERHEAIEVRLIQDKSKLGEELVRIFNAYKDWKSEAERVRDANKELKWEAEQLHRIENNCNYNQEYCINILTHDGTVRPLEFRRPLLELKLLDRLID